MFEHISNKSIRIYFYSKQYMLEKKIKKINYKSFEIFDGKNFLIPNQIHSTNVYFSNTPGQIDNCDGVFTSNPEVVCSIKVADCMPIFFAHRYLPFYGAVHAGWKGLTNGILKNTSILLENMKFCLDNFDIFIGPSIQRCCFEVSNDIVKRFPSKFVKQKSIEKFMVDLQKIAFEELQFYGFCCDKIKIIDDCSYCREDMYFSYRRDGANAKRMIGFIGFEA